MYKLAIILAISLCFGLVSCDKSEEIKISDHGVMGHASDSKHASMPMQHLNLLLEQAIAIMAQGADLKLHAQAHGDQLLSQSAGLLRRAMSGPEMAAMHKGGAGHSKSMQHTHDLGAAAFDLLDMMMSLKVKPNIPESSLTLHRALALAAQAANMKTIAAMGMSAEIDAAMQTQAIQLAQTLKQTDQLTASNTNTAYQQASLKVIDLLLTDL